LGHRVKSITQNAFGLYKYKPKIREILEIIVPSFYATRGGGGYSRALSTRMVADGFFNSPCGGDCGKNPFQSCSELTTTTELLQTLVRT